MNHSCTGPPGYLTSHPEGYCKVEIVPSHNLAGQFASDAGAAAGNTGEAFLEDGPQLRLIHALDSRHLTRHPRSTRPRAASTRSARRLRASYSCTPPPSGSTAL